MTAPVQAHGFGGARDLPVPLDLTVLGAVTALVASFAVLALAWRTTRWSGPTRPDRPAPAWLLRLAQARATRIAGRVVGLVAVLLLAVTLAAGRDSLVNPAFGIVFVWLWVGIVPWSLALGPVYRAISPVRTIHAAIAAATGLDRETGLCRYPERLGVWPAAAGLFAFVWFELVYPGAAQVASLGLWCAIYLTVMVIGGLVFGETFFARADPFEVYSSLVAKLSPWGSAQGRLVIRSPLANLATTRVRPGLVAVTGVLFGSTAYDSFRESTTFVGFVQSSSLTGTLWTNAALVGFCLLATSLFALGAAAATPEPGMRRRDLPGVLAPSLVPIIVGYMAAHYLSYYVEVGTRTLGYVSDPLTTGADLIGTATVEGATFFAYRPELLASLKVGAVVVGHVVAAVAAHDRALAVLSARHKVLGQVPLLVSMVVFTAGGLYLLFSS